MLEPDAHLQDFLIQEGTLPLAHSYGNAGEVLCVRRWRDVPGRDACALPSNGPPPQGAYLLGFYDNHPANAVP